LEEPGIIWGRVEEASEEGPRDGEAMAITMIVTYESKREMVHNNKRSIGDIKESFRGLL
jgi:hypothetical protein